MGHGNVLAGKSTLTYVVLNRKDAGIYLLRAPAFAAAGQPATARAFITQPKEQSIFAETTAQVSFTKAGLELHFELPTESVCTIIVSQVTRVQFTGTVPGVTAGQVTELAVLATLAAVTERRNGEFDNRTCAAWSRVEHACGCIAAMLPIPSQLEGLKQLILHVAWGVANERAFGRESKDAQACWERFHTQRERLGMSKDLDWAIFNTAWAVESRARLGTEDVGGQAAAQRAEEHLRKLGGRSTVVLPQKS